MEEVTLFEVLSAELYHETNTFSKRRTEYEDFVKKFLYFDNDALRERGKSNTELSGFLQCKNDYHWNMTHVFSSAAEPSGVVTDDAFERLIQPLIARVSHMKDSLHGILLGLHGAMVTNLYQDAEGEILHRIRKIVGSNIPIVITLDLHANCSSKMTQLANAIVSYKTYPHIDMQDTGKKAGNILQKIMKNEVKARVLTLSLPMIRESNMGRTDVGAMVDRIRKIKEYEEVPGILAVSINAGFPTNILECGPTVVIVYDEMMGGSLSDTQEVMDGYLAFANHIAMDIWNRRYEVVNKYSSVEEVAQIACEYNRSDNNGPLIIADYADNPGGGAYGDSTNLLKALLDHNITNVCFGALVDPEAVFHLRQYPIGSVVETWLGGKTDPSFGGPPLLLSMTVKVVSDGQYVGNGPMIGGLKRSFGNTVVVTVGEDVDILIVSVPEQILDLQQFIAFGINPFNKSVVALKSMQHFRAAFEPIAGRVVVCDSGALCTPDSTRFSFTRCRRPIFPIDQDFECFINIFK